MATAAKKPPPVLLVTHPACVEHEILNHRRTFTGVAGRLETLPTRDQEGKLLRAEKRRRQRAGEARPRRSRSPWAEARAADLKRRRCGACEGALAVTRVWFILRKPRLAERAPFCAQWIVVEG